MVKVKFKKLHPNAIIPKQATPGSSGFDVCLFNENPRGLSLRPNNVALAKTGLSVEVPKGYEIQVRSRSGMALKESVFVLNSPGTLDSDYRGEIGVILYNLSEDDRAFINGERIAQLVVCQVPEVEIEEVAELSDTERGAGGYGSTGK